MEGAGPLTAATGLVAALELFPHPADAFSQIGAVAGPLVESGAIGTLTSIWHDVLERPTAITASNLFAVTG